MKKVFLSIIFIALSASSLLAADEMLQLPAPEKTGGMSLLQAISERHSAREFADVDLTQQQLSNLLWAVAGVNRDDGRRVYPVSTGMQDTFVYVFVREGVYKYDPLSNALLLIEAGDHRADTTDRQDFVAKAAVNLVYVQDTSLWMNRKVPLETIQKWGFAHTGAAMQDAYLYAASQGWNAVVRAWADPTKLSKLLKLAEGQEVTLVQSIGPRAEH